MTDRKVRETAFAWPPRYWPRGFNSRFGMNLSNGYSGLRGALLIELRYFWLSLCCRLGFHDWQRYSGGYLYCRRVWCNRKGRRYE